MSEMKRLTALIHREGDWYVSFCPELNVTSQGETIEMARDNLREAVELTLECADEKEIEARLIGELYITPLEVAVG